MFAFFRAILVILTLGTLLLSIFAITGSYANKSYLTQAYLIDFQLNQLNLSAILDATKFLNSKLASPTSLDTRSTISDIGDAISLGINQIGSDVGAASTGSPSSGNSIGSDVNGYFTTVEAVINDIINSLDYQDLGFADVYTIGYWGYCKGSLTSNATYDQHLRKYFKPFNNDKINITWCSKPKAAYAFDPLELVKTELNNTITSRLTAGDVPKTISVTVQSELEVLLKYITYDTLNLPGSIQSDLTTLHNVTKASFGILLAVIVLAFISYVIQVVAFFLSPHSCCLSFLNFLFEGAIFLLGVVAAALATGAYLFVRNEVNKATNQYGVKSYLSTNFYAYIWSAAVASLLVVIFSFSESPSAFSISSS
ncbi:uncharacterized protein CANTADRAFT_6523 [Suhomyces tanzawaensis NRRL Y-17324]|uniref:Integral membrane protein n=1 Tax=Suhomyces tanzawaensis NRRL Y-17324 TaxID=984487 RepID=A0A1E4SIR0_9ASCO|nr:uncharacterized protein CANTADRAFT_6523 [Suhomyces tanzawaensis NRRL Y-17324]ODV79393.1 hypothetical protein CANTADRAFT_6523 [Suhomyces tanzawaensis NRRL Y-17324]